MEHELEWNRMEPEHFTLR